MPARPAAGGGRWVDVAPDRLTRWLNGFTGRHGQTGVELEAGVVHLSAADGSQAQLYPPPGAPLTETVEDFVDAALTERRLGLLLARQSAVAVGITQGPNLIASKVDTSYVQSRTAAGGWSQQRFARRRANQARAAFARAADECARLLVPRAGDLDALVCGGDRTAVEAVLADARLAPLAELPRGPFLAVPDPRLRVLQRTPEQFRAVAIELDP